MPPNIIITLWNILTVMKTKLKAMLIFRVFSNTKHREECSAINAKALNTILKKIQS